jgi:uncharacterized GH25 family protein
MKKLTIAALIAVSLSQTACAHNGWVAPALIGGAVGYALAQPRYYGPPPPQYYSSSQQGYVCPYGTTPTYQQQVRYDNYGRPFTYNVWLGCR